MPTQVPIDAKDGDGGIEMRATDGVHAVPGDRDREGPPRVKHQPIEAPSFAANYVSDDAVRAREELGPKSSGGEGTDVIVWGVFGRDFVGVQVCRTVRERPFSAFRT